VTKIPPRGTQAGMVDTDEGAGGEPLISDAPITEAPSNLPTLATTTPVPAVAPGQVAVGSTAASSPASSSMPYQYSMDYSGSDQAGGQTMGAETLQLEVDILSADAVDRIAHAVAQRVAKKAGEAKITGITVVSPTTLAALRLHSVLEAQVKSLEAMAAQLGGAVAPESVETADAAFTDLPLRIADTAQRVAKSAAAAISVFASTTAYAGKKDTGRQTVLDAALAKHLAARNLQVELPEHALPAAEPALFTRMLNLRARCSELQRQGADLNALVEISGAADSLLKLVFGPAEGAPPGVSMAQQMMLADLIAAGLVARRAVLFAEIAFSGGSYRTRKWIFNTLFGREGLTYSGGAGVTYFLFRGDDRSTLDSDTLYFASPHGRFEHASGRQFQSSNLNG